jgi:uncharacterized protein YndB with AHSA1/START domain
MKNSTNVQRTSERELVATRTINGPSELVFEAWANPKLFQKWWVPKSAPIKLESCDMDIRTGGTYRLKFSVGAQMMEFFGKYLEVTPHKRLVWTNEENGEGGAVITTVTFEEKNSTTLVTVHDLYPTKESLDEAIANGSTGAFPEQFEQLEELIANQKGL